MKPERATSCGCGSGIRTATEGLIPFVMDPARGFNGWDWETVCASCNSGEWITRRVAVDA